MKTENQNVIEKLNKLLADYQIYYQNLRGLHWNVKGAMFFMLHEKYEELYNQAAEVVDEIAERILMVGGKPLHTFGDYIQTATLKEVKLDWFCRKTNLDAGVILSIIHIPP
jgi:starvation-inducible DNA-binding protein